MRALSALIFGTLVVCVFALLLLTSLDFQQCIKSYGENDPSAEHLQKGVSVFVSPFPSYRHCIGAYVADKNAVITALGTLVIAVFTTVLGVFTISLARSTRIAAEAAQKAGDAAFAAERASFFIVIEHHNLFDVIKSIETQGTIASGTNFSIQYRFQNYGKTPGIIKALTLGSMIAPDPVDPQSHSIIFKDFLEYMIGANGSIKTDWFSPITPPTLSQIQAIGRNSERFWFYGRLYYDDVFGNHQVHKFYFRSNRIIGGICLLQPCDYKDHNKST
jgi:hypothetical protein